VECLGKEKEHSKTFAPRTKKSKPEAMMVSIIGGTNEEEKLRRVKKIGILFIISN